MNKEELEKLVTELHDEQGLSWNQVKYALTEEEGVSEIDARKIIDKFRELEEEKQAIQQEAQKEIEAKAQLEEILREDESNPPMQRADNKVTIGFLLVILGIVLFFILPPISSRSRIAACVCVTGIIMICTGFKHRSIIKEHKNARQDK